jgi:membrane protein required for colicin V production
LNWVDVFALLIAGGFFIYGVARGFILQLAGLVVLVGSLVLASLLSGPAGRWVHSHWPSLDADISKWLAFGIIALLGLLIGSGLSHLLRSGLEKARLLAHDRLLGGVLGALKGILLVVIILQVTLNLTLSPDQEPTGFLRVLTRSRAARVAAWTTDRVLVFLPAGMSDWVRDHDRLNPREKPPEEPNATPAGPSAGTPAEKPAEDEKPPAMETKAPAERDTR